MKELKPFRSPRTSASFPEVEAAILIFLELTKKKKIPISTLKTAQPPYRIAFPLFRYYAEVQTHQLL